MEKYNQCIHLGILSWGALSRCNVYYQGNWRLLKQSHHKWNGNPFIRSETENHFLMTLKGREEERNPRWMLRDNSK